jgi:hypothetical protein
MSQTGVKFSDQTADQQRFRREGSFIFQICFALKDFWRSSTYLEDSMEVTTISYNLLYLLGDYNTYSRIKAT